MVFQKLSWNISLNSLVVLPTWVYHVYKGQLQSVAAKDLPQLMHHQCLMSSSKFSKSKTWGKNWGENREEKKEHNWEHNLGTNYFREEKKYPKNTFKIPKKHLNNT